MAILNSGEMATMSLEEQQAPLGPPNLYVDTPTTENQFPLEAAAAEPPALQPSVDAETEVWERNLKIVHILWNWNHNYVNAL